MAAPKRRLGRGLASLINEEANVAAITAIEGMRNVAIEAVKPSPYNPRATYAEEELDELADSIREKGVVQPIIVRPSGGDGGGYEIVAGERRWRAAQRAGLHQLPVIVRTLTDQEALELAIIENVQRADLNPMEEARGYKQLIDRFDHTQEDLSGIVGKSRSHLANMLRLLRLPEPVQALVEDGSLSPGHARPLIGRDDAEALARKIVQRGLNVRDVEAMVQRASSAAARPKKVQVGNADTRAAEAELAEALGLSVAICPGRGERGEIRIAYRTLEQFEEVRTRLLTRRQKQ
jgi:ParB family chromosome partitioning protein